MMLLIFLSFRFQSALLALHSTLLLLPLARKAACTGEVYYVQQMMCRKYRAHSFFAPLIIHSIIFLLFPSFFNKLDLNSLAYRPLFLIN